ncbi:hypothetical protein D9M70_614090 [compost metagenome]
MCLELLDEGEDAGFVCEVGLQAGGAQRAELRDARALLAIADDQRMTVFQQTGRAVQADALAGAGDQDGSRSCAHASLVQFEGTGKSDCPSREIGKLYQPLVGHGTVPGVA